MAHSFDVVLAGPVPPPVRPPALLQVTHLLPAFLVELLFLALPQLAAVHQIHLEQPQTDLFYQSPVP